MIYLKQSIVITFLVWCAWIVLGVWLVKDVGTGKKKIGALQDIQITERPFGDLSEITLTGGTIFMASGSFSAYRPGDDVSAPDIKAIKFVCLRDSCLPLER